MGCEAEQGAGISQAGWPVLPCLQALTRSTPVQGAHRSTTVRMLKKRKPEAAVRTRRHTGLQLTMSRSLMLGHTNGRQDRAEEPGHDDGNEALRVQGGGALHGWTDRWMEMAAQMCK
jgi:hypothetical protein